MSAVIEKGKRPGIVSRYFSNVARTKTPRKVKRLIYLSTILGMLQNQKDPDIELVKKLNEIFQVARDPNAYLFPMHIRSMIWKGHCGSTIKLVRGVVPITEIKNLNLTDTDATDIGVYFAEHSPEWIRYGSNDLLISDVKKMLQQLMDYNHKHCFA